MRDNLMEVWKNLFLIRHYLRTQINTSRSPERYIHVSEQIANVQLVIQEEIDFLWKNNKD